MDPQEDGYRALYEEVQGAIREAVRGAGQGAEGRLLLEVPGAADRVVEILKERVPKYSWVGVYRTEGEDLILGPFRGAPSPHRRIKIGKEGICGWVAGHGVCQIVPDVRSDARYLMCSQEIQSEIVVPIVSGEPVLGVIDIDSARPDAFGEEDRSLLERVAALLATPCGQVPRGVGH